MDGFWQACPQSSMGNSVIQARLYTSEDFRAFNTQGSFYRCSKEPRFTFFTPSAHLDPTRQAEISAMGQSHLSNCCWHACSSRAKMRLSVSKHDWSLHHTADSVASCSLHHLQELSFTSSSNVADWGQQIKSRSTKEKQNQTNQGQLRKYPFL